MAQSSFLENDSPVDFLYLDRPRISSLIGQLSEKGVLTGLKSVAAKNVQHETSGSGSVPGFAAGGVKRTKTSSDTSEEIYDPFWTTIHTFIQEMEANFAIPLHRARLGSMVSFDALIQFVDLRMMKNLWEPSMALVTSQAQASGMTNASRKKRREQNQNRPAVNDAKILIQILKEVPHLLHMTFLTQSEDGIIFNLWASIRPEYLSINSEDLAMKYGAVIDGMWRVVGILDARAGKPVAPLPVNQMIDGAIEGLAAIRLQVGRPESHFGITPIAIYSQINGLPESEALASMDPLDVTE